MCKPKNEKRKEAHQCGTPLFLFVGYTSSESKLVPASQTLVKHIEGVSDDDIVGVNIPTGVPLVYEFDDSMNVISKRYLGDQDVIAAKINGVANQAKKK